MLLYVTVMTVLNVMKMEYCSGCVIAIMIVILLPEAKYLYDNIGLGIRFGYLEKVHCVYSDAAQMTH